MVNVMKYVTQERKTMLGDQWLVTGHNCVAQSSYLEMMTTKRQFQKTDGRQFYHFVQSFSADDMPLRPSVVHQRLHRILDHAGCERVRFHDLRHTFATNALSYGMDIKTLSTILGHVSSATTLNTYSHITDEMRQKAAAKIDMGIAKAEPQLAEESTPQERTMTTFQARKCWSRKVG